MFGFESRFGTETSTAPEAYTTQALTLENDPEMAFAYTPASMVQSGGAVTRWRNAALSGTTLPVVAAYDMDVAGSGDSLPTWNTGGGYLDFNGSTHSITTDTSSTPLTARLLDNTKNILTVMGVFEGVASSRDVFIALCESNTPPASIYLGWDTQSGSTSDEQLNVLVRGVGTTFAGDANSATPNAGPPIVTGKHLYEIQITLTTVKVLVDGVLRYEITPDAEDVPDISAAIPRRNNAMYITLGGLGTPVSAPNRQSPFRAFSALATYNEEPEKIRALLAQQHGIALP